MRGGINVKRTERNEAGKGRKNRYGVSLPHDDDTSLQRLAVSCGMTPTTLAYKLIKYCLDDASIVDLFQLDYNVNPSYWVVPVRSSKDGSKRLGIKKDE
jgi:hypothetical protein